MYKYISVFFWISALYIGTATKEGPRKLDNGLKAVLRCAPSNADYAIDIIQHFQNGNFARITKLNLANCKIANLPSGIFKFQEFIRIRILDLKHNRISRLPSDIFHSSALFTLEKLYLDYNQITYLSPKEFLYLYKLDHLGLTYNKLKHLESGIFATNPLVNLSLSSNHLENLPGDLLAGNISASLKILQLKHNRLTEIPPCLLQSDASEGIFPTLEALDLSYNNIKELPTELFNSTHWSSLKELNLGHNSLTELPPRIFSSMYLQNVRQITLSHNKLRKMPIQSSKLDNLEGLLLDNNQISYFPPNQFVHFQKLKSLDLRYNKFRDLETGVFTSDSLTTLYLSENMLETLPGNWFGGSSSVPLKYLLLKRNQLTEVPQCLYQSNGSQAFSQIFSKLEVLDLNYNSIKYLPSHLFNSKSWSSLTKIYLSHNNISSLPNGILNSSYLHSLRIIKLAFNNLKTLPMNLFSNPALSNLDSLKFNNNHITVLPEELFHSPYLQRVSLIDLSNNRIKSVPVNFFKHLPNLKQIFLGNNNIKHISEMMLPNRLYHLCHLDLSHNKISSTGDFVKRALENISNSKKCKLDLSYNGLTVQQTNFFPLRHKKARFQMLGNLDLSYNNISKFEVASCESVNFFYISFSLSSQKKVWLDTRGNKIFSVVNLVQAALNIDLNHLKLGCLNTTKRLTQKEIRRLIIFINTFTYTYNCNCDMFKYLELQNLDYFRKAAKKYKTHIYFGRFTFKRLKCGLPKHLSGKYLYQLDEIELQCEHSRCTNNINCTCIETPSNSTLRINCTGTKIKHMEQYNIQSFSKAEICLGFNFIQEISIAPMTSVYVILLDLSFNLITNIPKTFFISYPKLRFLNLAGNCLTVIPSFKDWNHLSSLQALEFSGNNFTCNCLGLGLKQILSGLYLKANITIKDLNQIKCSSPSFVKGSVIYTLPDSLFGCPYVNLVLILTLTLSLLLFVSLALFLAYVFRYYISLFLFIHCGWRFCYSYTKDETLYDTFISYSSKDSDWVTDQLMNPLENLNPPYNLCLHERDFLVGVPICDNITTAIEGSKCTVCVVSRNWLESDWCQFEFRVAHCLATVEKKTRLLVILKEEIPNDKIKGDLKFYMKTFTYLDAASPLFWSKLLNDLPRPDGEEIMGGNEQSGVIELI